MAFLGGERRFCGSVWHAQQREGSGDESIWIYLLLCLYENCRNFCGDVSGPGGGDSVHTGALAGNHAKYLKLRSGPPEVFCRKGSMRLCHRSADISVLSGGVHMF